MISSRMNNKNNSGTVIVVVLVSMISCLVLLSGGAAAVWWWWYYYKNAPAPAPSGYLAPKEYSVNVPPGSGSGSGGGPLSPSTGPEIPVPIKTGSITADVHVLEEKDAVMVNYEGFDVWAPKEIVATDKLTGGKGRVVLKDYMWYMFKNENCATLKTTPGYVVKEWDTNAFWPDWAKEDYQRDWPRGKKFRFTCLWVRVLGVWFVIPRRDFLGEELAHKRLVASARVLSMFYEGMRPVIETMITQRSKIRPEFRLSDSEVALAKELIEGKTAWQSENLPTEWFALGGGDGSRVSDDGVYERMINGSKHGFAFDLATKDPKTYAESIFGIAVHEDCHCMCTSPACSDDCIPGHSSRFQQLEFICINFLQNNGIHGRKKGDVHPCFGDSSACNNPQPAWLPVKNNANGGTACNVDPNTYSTDLSLF
jgi:hypothetical protein